MKELSKYERLYIAAKKVCNSIEYYDYVKKDYEMNDEYDLVMKPIWQELDKILEEK